MDHRSDGCISLRPPTGAETTDDFAMDDRRSQIPFTYIVGRIDVGAIQEDEQAVPVFEVPFLQSPGFFLWQGTFEQPVAKVFNPADLCFKLWRRQLISPIMQMNGGTEQRLHGSGPKRARITVDHSLQLAQLMGHAQLAIAGGCFHL